MITTITDIYRLKLLQAVDTDYNNYHWYEGEVEALWTIFIKQLRSKDV